MSNFFFCHYVFKKLSAAEASESVYMRGMVNVRFIIYMHLTGADKFQRQDTGEYGCDTLALSEIIP